MNNQEFIHSLHQLSRYFTNKVNQTLKPFGLYNAQWSVIFVLRKNGSMTQKEICTYLSVEAPPLTRTVQRLVKQGFVKQVQGKDKREKYIELTEDALKEYPKWEKAVNELDRSLLQYLPEGSKGVLSQELKGWLEKLPR
jgi:DNA-binding MarR family transcriptional regulator